MRLFDPNNPNEKKKIIAAAVLGIAAIIVLGYVFLGGSSSKSQANRNRAIPTPPVTTVNKLPADDATQDNSINLQPIPASWSVPAVPEANRNIFAYYEPPPPPVRVSTPSPPSPTPTPPLAVNSLSPSNVYARTADFSLQVMGDKFTPAVHVTIDGRDLPTRFINPQQIATTVPSSIITNPGMRQVIVRSNDGKLYSNMTTLNVTAPPLPNYNYIGIIGKRSANDLAVLQDKSSKELLNVQRGDVLGGRFRVNSISEREIVLVDTTLKIRHTIPFSVENTNPQARPPVRVSDEEP